MPGSNILISYSRQDAWLANELLRHLGPLERQGLVRPWIDQQIRPGANWLNQTLEAMGTVDLAAVLISADSLASDFIQRTEIPFLLERRNTEGLHLMPILARNCVWEEESWLAPLQIWPKSCRALSSFRGNRFDTELKVIVQEILRCLRENEPPKYAHA